MNARVMLAGLFLLAGKQPRKVTLSVTLMYATVVTLLANGQMMLGLALNVETAIRPLRLGDSVGLRLNTYLCVKRVLQ